MPSFAPDIVTALSGAAGVLLVIVGKLTLGRSFGIVPANRGVVARGPYLARPSPDLRGLSRYPRRLPRPPWAVERGDLLIADGALVMRALIEERVLRADAAYQAYCRRVGWHLVPGVF